MWFSCLAVFCPWSWDVLESWKGRMLTSNIYFTLQFLLITSYKAFGVLKWWTAIKIEICTCCYHKYIRRTNFVLMLFSWWIFTHSPMFLHLFIYIYIFSSTLFRQPSRKWSRRQNNSQTQSKSSLWRWLWQKTEYLQVWKTERTPLLSWHALLYSGGEDPLMHIMQANTSPSLHLKYTSSPILFFSYFLM